MSCSSRGIFRGHSSFRIRYSLRRLPYPPLMYPSSPHKSDCNTATSRDTDAFGVNDRLNSYCPPLSSVVILSSVPFINNTMTSARKSRVSGSSPDRGRLRSKGSARSPYSRRIRDTNALSSLRDSDVVLDCIIVSSGASSNVSCPRLTDPACVLQDDCRTKTSLSPASNCQDEGANSTTPSQRSELRQGPLPFDSLSTNSKR